MALAALIVSIVALLVSGFSAWNGHRSAAAAGRSAEAAEGSRDATQRSATASEQQAKLATAAAERYDIPWTLTSAEGDMVRLTNTNRSEACEDVTVELMNGRGVPQDAPQGATIPAGSSVDFFGERGTFSDPDTRIRVLWRRPGEEAFRGPWIHPSDL